MVHKKWVGIAKLDGEIEIITSKWEMGAWEGNHNFKYLANVTTE